MDYHQPLIFTLSTQATQAPAPDHFIIHLPQTWNNYKQQIYRAAQSVPFKFDYVAIAYDESLNNDNRFVSKHSLDIYTNEICRLGTSYQCPVITRYQDECYQLNAKYKAGEDYMPSNQEVLDKYNHYANEGAWQRHQSKVWQAFAEINPLKQGDFPGQPDHLSLLTEPKRGLSKDDVRDFFSLTNGKALNPALLHDDLIGMPGIRAREMSDTFSYHGRPVSSHALALSTIGNGYIIPMRNRNGDMAKFQIGTDISKYNLVLKARAQDGVAIQRSEIYDREKNCYTFNLQSGGPSHLHVESADNHGVTLEDAKGQFHANLKQDIKPLLVQRGYDLPPIIDTIQPVPKSKYMWPAPGSMVGVKDDTLDVPKLVSPSRAGFIPVREPDRPQQGYTVLVVEGALKGRIVAKYLQNEDVKKCTDPLMGGKGLLVAQVPGVAKAFIDSVDEIEDTYDVQSYLIALDTDGKQNKSVAKGVHDSVDYLAQRHPTEVLVWNAKQKGLDDALIALANHRITPEELQLSTSTPDRAYPLEQAESPNPYRLDGSRANRLDWQIEYNRHLKEETHKRQVTQQRSEERAEKRLAGKPEEKSDEHVSSNDRQAFIDCVNETAPSSALQH